MRIYMLDNGVDAYGVMGQVVMITPKISRVLLVTDAKSATGKGCALWSARCCCWHRWANDEAD